MQDTVVEIDPAQHLVKGASGNRYKYDTLVVSPGIAYDWDAIEGMSEAVADQIPHAWKAGPQTRTLRKQLEAMDDGGVLYVVAPPSPFRCPPGPYERAAQFGHYFSNQKPKSKIVILDAKDAFSKHALFQAGWQEHYDDRIEWVLGGAGRDHQGDRSRDPNVSRIVRGISGRRHQSDPASKGRCLGPSRRTRE
jgi:sulfide dehydrogenase [flavocytochrome c] flavoprotein subunit